MGTIKKVLIIGLVLFLLYVLMIIIREMKGVSSGSNTNTTTIYRRTRTPVAGPNPNVRRVHYYN